MKTQLSIQERLKDLRVEKGLTLEQLSQQTKIPASTLGSYESDDYKEIPHRNIFDLAKFYGVSADYLLGMTENRQLDNISISELHLSDDTLSLLKDQKINTLLLSELITHIQPFAAFIRPPGLPAEKSRPPHMADDGHSAAVCLL